MGESSPEESSKAELTKKQELNNHKVLMRKWIRQAKVHVVHKLDREIKKLRERKGDEKVKEKCFRKADRLCKEVLAIKDVEIDDVAIKALLNDRPLDAVLTDTGATPEERAVSRLIHHNAVQLEVQKYRSQNPHWRLQIPVLLERSKQKEKIAEKKRYEKLKRKQRHQEKPRTTTTLKPADDDDDNDSRSASDSSTERPGPDETSRIQTPAEQSSPSIVTPVVVKPTQEAATKRPVKSSPKLTPAKTSESSKPELQPVELDKIEGTIKVQVIKDWSDFERSVTQSASASAESLENKVDLTAGPEKKKPRSSFFLGGEDDPEVQNRMIEEPKRTARIEPKSLRNSKPGPVRPWRMNLDSAESEPSHPRSKTSKTPRYFDKPLAKSFADSNKKTEARTISPKSAAVAEKLHPSWEAKKRQSVAPASFQGKKIKFDD